jgi:asparagine synthase (glutamine-hydrolysing)
MCGINGIVSLAPDTPPVDPDIVRRMTARLEHRGPDDEGFYTDPQRRCALGFRRLSIIDVAGGHQPLSNEDGTVWVILNGEIYNFGQLRTELERSGHIFETRTDTEVIVHLYEEHGERCFELLHGMFAFALWDQARGQLFLARDRLGKKPLQYALHDGRLYFASELKAILAVPGIPREIDPQSLHRYLVLQYVPAPHCIFRGFRKVLPGTFVRIDGGAARPPQPFWSISPPSTFAGTYADAEARLGELLKKAVEKRLVADVPLGAFLSGGLDSSIVVALMRELGVAPLRTFSIGFSDARYDESGFARQVAEQFGTEHHEHIVTPEARAVLDTLAYHYDEPFADSSAIPTYYVSKWARQSVTVALTGDGGDECFGGYERYRAARLAARLDWVPRPIRRAIAAAAGIFPHAEPRTLSNRLYRFAMTLGDPPAARYLSWVGVFNPGHLASGYAEGFGRACDASDDWLSELYEASPGTPANRAMATDLVSYLPYDLLTKVDIASMAVSLECRCPFLDHELVEFAVSLPVAWRMGGTGKRLLRDWAGDRLPAAILRRAKMGFGVPVAAWLRNDLRDVLRDRLLAPESLPIQIFRPEWLQQLVDQHLSGSANHEHRLWALLMLELWNTRWQPTLPLS